MKWTRRALAIAGAILFLSGCSCAKAEPAVPSGTTADSATTATAPLKIGVYDTRSVTIAFVSGKNFQTQAKAEEAALKAAKASGDKKRIKAADKRVWATRKRIGLQGFGQAPVDDILAQYPAEVQALMKKHGLTALVPEWDRWSLWFTYHGAERVDVTGDLVEVFHPTARGRKSALGNRVHWHMPNIVVRFAMAVAPDKM